MNRNLKSLVLTVAIVLTIGFVSISYAATSSEKTVDATTTATTKNQHEKAPKLSQKQAKKIALQAHPGAKLVSIKLIEAIYIAKLTVNDIIYTLEIDVNTGKIIKENTANM
jgi:uncharacterized membrane protein YkoI